MELCVLDAENVHLPETRKITRIKICGWRDRSIVVFKLDGKITGGRNIFKSILLDRFKRKDIYFGTLN